MLFKKSVAQCCGPNIQDREIVIKARKRVAMKRYLAKKGLILPSDTPTKILRIITKYARLAG